MELFATSRHRKRKISTASEIKRNSSFINFQKEMTFPVEKAQKYSPDREEKFELFPTNTYINFSPSFVCLHALRQHSLVSFLAAVIMELSASVFPTRK